MYSSLSVQTDQKLILKKQNQRSQHTNNSNKELNITYGWLQKPFLALLRVKTPTLLIAGASAATENPRPRLRFTPAPPTARPVIISQTGILALLRLRLMYFLIPIAFPSSSFFPSTWRKRNAAREKAGWRRREVAGQVARGTKTSRVLDDGGGAVGHGSSSSSSSEVAATADCDEGRRDKGRLQTAARGQMVKWGSREEQSSRCREETLR